MFKFPEHSLVIQELVTGVKSGLIESAAETKNNNNNKHSRSERQEFGLEFFFLLLFL